MRLKMSFVFLFVSAMSLVSFSSTAQASSQQETLDQYISDLQKNPGDNSLCEKIIKLAQEMKPAPAIPAEAEKFSDRAEYAAKTAKTEADFADAAKEYEKAISIAPWITDYYFNLAVMQEKANQPQKAANSFTLYLLAQPDSKDARKVRKRIAGLEYAAEKVAKESSPEAVAAQKEDAYTVWLKSIDGAKFIGPPSEDGQIGHEGKLMFLVFHISGSEARHGWIEGVRASDDLRYAPIRDVSFNDGSMIEPVVNKQFKLPKDSSETDQRPCTGTISDDGQFLSKKCPSSGVPFTYTRIK